MKNTKANWWKEAVIYQIYPRSFKDINGDGIGDLKGIISKLDYIKELGVDVIWLCPIYESPNDDNGYDISEYCSIHPEFGTMADFDELLREIHSRGLRLIMDVVLNHSSDEHEWFGASRSSKTNPYRDFYFWRPGKNGGPPNNWKAFFGGSAWAYDETTEEYYLHLFTKKQPDLNWENPKVRAKLYEVLRFWLDKGIDGFRMDVISLISKRLDFADTDIAAFNDVVEQVYSNGPKVHAYINEMYEEVLQHYDIMTVGEGPGISEKEGLKYVGHDRRELNMIFHLDHMFLGHGPLGKFDPVPYDWMDVKRIFEDWDSAIGDSGWLSIFLDNHDFPRLVSRFGNDKEYRTESAKLLAMLVLTLRGTPCIYQGTELGMTNVQFDKIEDYRDVEIHNKLTEFLDNGGSKEGYLALVHEHGRDNARTPIQWNAEHNGGFSTGTAWIKPNPNYKDINTAQVLADENSIYAFYQKMLHYRKANSTLVYGTFQAIKSTSDNIFAYYRTDSSAKLLVILNHSDRHEDIDISLENYQLEFSNILNKMDKVLVPWEARIYKSSIL